MSGVAHVAILKMRCHTRAFRDAIAASSLIGVGTCQHNPRPPGARSPVRIGGRAIMQATRFRTVRTGRRSAGKERALAECRLLLSRRAGCPLLRALCCSHDGLFSVAGSARVCPRWRCAAQARRCRSTRMERFRDGAGCRCLEALACAGRMSARAIDGQISGEAGAERDARPSLGTEPPLRNTGVARRMVRGLLRLRRDRAPGGKRIDPGVGQDAQNTPAHARAHRGTAGTATRLAGCGRRLPTRRQGWQNTARGRLPHAGWTATKGTAHPGGPHRSGQYGSRFSGMAHDRSHAAMGGAARLPWATHRPVPVSLASWRTRSTIRSHPARG